MGGPVTYDPPDIGSVSKDVPRCPIFLKNKDFALGIFRWTTQMVVKMVVRPIAKLSEELDQLCLATVLSGRRRAAIRANTGHDAFMSPHCAGHVQIDSASRPRLGVVWQVRPRSFAATVAGRADGSTAGTSDSATVSLSSRSVPTTKRPRRTPRRDQRGDPRLQPRCLWPHLRRSEGHCTELADHQCVGGPSGVATVVAQPHPGELGLCTGQALVRDLAAACRTSYADHAGNYRAGRHFAT